MGLIAEFKAFALRGSVVDLAVGVIIGGAFGKIVSSFVNDVLMPPIGLIVGGMDFTDLAFTLKQGVGEAPAVTLKYGNFLQSTFDFLIVAFSIFLFIKALNTLQRKQAAAPPPPAPPPKQELLLAEIRDILKAK